MLYEKATRPLILWIEAVVYRIGWRSSLMCCQKWLMEAHVPSFPRAYSVTRSKPKNFPPSNAPNLIDVASLRQMCESHMLSIFWCLSELAQTTSHLSSYLSYCFFFNLVIGILLYLKSKVKNLKSWCPMITTPSLISWRSLSVTTHELYLFYFFPVGRPLRIPMEKCEFLQQCIMRWS